MIDIKLLRETPEKVRAAIARKKFKVDIDKVSSSMLIDVSSTASGTGSSSAIAAAVAANKRRTRRGERLRAAAQPRATRKLAADRSQLVAFTAHTSPWQIVALRPRRLRRARRWSYSDHHRHSRSRTSRSVFRQKRARAAGCPSPLLSSRGTAARLSQL